MRTTPINSGYTIINGVGTGTNGSKIDVWLEYKILSQNIAANTSQLSVFFYAALKPGESSSTSYDSGLNSTLTVNGVAGTGVSNGPYDFTSSANIHTLGSYSGTITHNADGTKSISISGQFTTRSTYISGGNVSGTVVLPTIPRATTPSMASSVTMGTATTISLSPASASFTHTLRYGFGSSSGTIATKTASTSISYTFALSLASNIPNATSGTGTLYCDTYSGDTLIGTKSISFTLVVPTSVVPTASFTVAESVSGIATQFGCYVQNKSKLQIVITAAGVYGSSISAYKTTVNGSTYTTSTVTTDVLKTAGTNTITVEVTDSRGRKKTVSQTITVIAYQSPVISSLTAFRCDVNGNAVDDGTYIHVNMVGSVSPVYNGTANKNTKAFKVLYRQVGTTTYTTQTVTVAGYTIDGNTSIILSGMNIDYSYDIRGQITDYFTTISRDIVVSTAATVLDFRANGLGLSIGKASEQDGLEVGFDAVFKGSVAFEGPSDFEMIGVGRTPIPDNTNINNWLTVRNSKVASNASALTMTNLPEQAAGNLDNIYITGSQDLSTAWSYKVQKYTTLAGVTYARAVYTDGSNTKIYGGWGKPWTSLNDGAGSGLDADLIQGQTYESGSWTPTLYGATTAGTPTYTYRAGHYTKVGQLVTLSGVIQISAKGGMAGDIRIGGLPFTAAEAGAGVTGLSQNWTNVSTHYLRIQMDKVNYLSLRQNLATLTAADITDSFVIWGFSVTFVV